MSIQIDARGLVCPQPVIATKKALEGITDDTIITVVDNYAAKENVLKFASANRCEANWEEKNGDYYITIIKGKGAAAETILPETKGKLVYLIKQNTLGQGSAELGDILVKSFFYALLEKEPLPKTIFFINNAIFLTTEASPVIEYLIELEKRGVQLLSCGTCLDYYDRKEQLLVGGITNMYAIVEELSDAGKAITL